MTDDCALSQDGTRMGYSLHFLFYRLVLLWVKDKKLTSSNGLGKGVWPWLRRRIGMEDHKISGAWQIRVERYFFKFFLVGKCAEGSITIRMYIMDVNLAVLLGSMESVCNTMRNFGDERREELK